MFDLVTAFKVFGDLGITARPVSASWLWEKPTLGRFLDSIGAIPMRTGREYIETVEHCLRCLDQGDTLLVMPEGRLVPAEERIDGVGPGHKVLSKIATRAGVPVVPAALTGTDEFWPHHRSIPRLRPARVTVTCEFGAPRVYGPNHRENVDATISDLRALLNRPG
jgi:1-acyl-sn-glycerol-3-phosphate acyltransferase